MMNLLVSNDLLPHYVHEGMHISGDMLLDGLCIIVIGLFLMWINYFISNAGIKHWGKIVWSVLLVIGAGIMILGISVNPYMCMPTPEHNDYVLMQNRKAYNYESKQASHDVKDAAKSSGVEKQFDNQDYMHNHKLMAQQKKYNSLHKVSKLGKH